MRMNIQGFQADVDSHAAKYRPWKLKTYLVH